MAENLDHEITPKDVYVDRRTFLKGGVLAATVVGTAVVYKKLNGVDLDTTKGDQIAGLVKPPHTNATFVEGEALTPRASVLNYNNFYEFTTNKDGVAAAAKDFKTAGWKIEVGGLCNKPRVFDIDDFRKLAPTEERVYRHRCVEAWSMVVPWAGFSVSNLLKAVDPQGSAKFVAFETLFDPVRMPNQKTGVLKWPYKEGLRMDEAMHPLALFATGLYGETLPPQDGAPVKLVLPWKYGFKGIKSIVKITLVDKQPPSTWQDYAPKEYGFYGNVNPQHDHPRWTQHTEQRLGESGRRKTLPFNGYAAEVTSMYAGMDLDVDF